MKLTDRQSTIVRLLLSGHTLHEVARQLGCSRSTVDRELVYAKAKIGATTRKEMWQWWTAQ